MNDIVLKAQRKDNGEPPQIRYADVVDTYKAICEHRAPVQQQAATGH